MTCYLGGNEANRFTSPSPPSAATQLLGLSPSSSLRSGSAPATRSKRIPSTSRPAISAVSNTPIPSQSTALTSALFSIKSFKHSTLFLSAAKCRAVCFDSSKLFGSAPSSRADCKALASFDSAALRRRISGVSVEVCRRLSVGSPDDSVLWLLPKPETSPFKLPSLSIGHPSSSTSSGPSSSYTTSAVSSPCADSPPSEKWYTTSQYFLMANSLGSPLNFPHASYLAYATTLIFEGGSPARSPSTACLYSPYIIK
mmetsp:Transcript_36840/g.88076  ORF Transcript_36840/g.88076 Transcript_36840/m.88076 type:complete len:255 (-) Transcript_36840:719-1483(-)